MRCCGRRQSRPTALLVGRVTWDYVRLMTMKRKLIIALVGSVLTMGMATTVASAGRGGPPNPSDPNEEVFERDDERVVHEFRELDQNGEVVQLLEPDPAFPTTSQDCRWTGFNTYNHELDSAYWLYYREYYNQVEEGLGDSLYGKQGDCMKNKGVDPLGS